MIMPKGSSITTQTLDHLGLVAATIDNLDIVNEIDKLIPLDDRAKTTIGQRVASMILNGLGFVDDRLYLFPKFLENKPVAKLLGENLEASDFNDDSLGRGLDKIYEYGISKLFAQLAFKIGVKNNLLGRSMHIDTTTLTVYGDYDGIDPTEIDTISDSSDELEVEQIARPEFGHAKNKRFDLKQMVLTLATTGKAGFPMWMESHSGNVSDSKSLQETAQRIQNFCKQLENAPSFIYVGDSAMYNNCVKHGSNLLWLSRVPEQIRLAKELLDISDIEWVTLNDNYKYYATNQTHGDVAQRWLLVFSQAAYDREIATLNNNIKKEHDAITTQFWHLSNEKFECDKDCMKRLDLLTKTWKYHKVDAKAVEIKKHTKSGRPAKGDIPVTIGYQIVGNIVQDAEAIEKIRGRKGKFILATNQLDQLELSDSQMLEEYKGQMQVESGFKFIKDNSFEVSSIFLKKPERISSLMMVMTLCLMVYNSAQNSLYNALAENNETVKNQINKPTNRPSMKWIYRSFLGVSVVKLHLGHSSQEVVTNVTPELQKIVKLFGAKAKEIYESE